MRRLILALLLAGCGERGDVDQRCRPDGSCKGNLVCIGYRYPGSARCEPNR